MMDLSRKKSWDKMNKLVETDEQFLLAWAVDHIMAVPSIIKLCAE